MAEAKFKVKICLKGWYWWENKEKSNLPEIDKFYII